MVIHRFELSFLNFNTRLYLLIALVIISFSVMSLGTNLANLQYQNAHATTETNTLTTITPKSSSLIQVNYSSNYTGPSALWYLAALVLFLATISIFVYIKGRNKRFPNGPSIVSQIIGAITAILFWILLVRVLVSSQNSSPYTGILELVGQSLLIVILVLAVTFGFAIIFSNFDVFHGFRKANKITSSDSPSNGFVQERREEDMEELEGILRRAEYSLRAGEDYQDVIIDCYKSVVLLLGKAGMPQKESLTAREFEQEISSRLGVKASDALRKLTTLFERARYGIEMFSEEDAVRAQQHLKDLRGELQSEISEMREPLLKR